MNRPVSFSRFRIEAGLTIDGVAEEFGLGSDEVEAWECGSKKPPEYVIPPRLCSDLFEVGVAGEGAQAVWFGHEGVPGRAAGVHDGLVVSADSNVR